jgi:hypothetical protein
MEVLVPLSPSRVSCVSPVNNPTAYPCPRLSGSRCRIRRVCYGHNPLLCNVRRLLLAWLSIRPWSWRRCVPPKRQWTSTVYTQRYIPEGSTPFIVYKYVQFLSYDKSFYIVTITLVWVLWEFAVTESIWTKMKISQQIYWKLQTKIPWKLTQ